MRIYALMSLPVIAGLLLTGCDGAAQQATTDTAKAQSYLATGTTDANEFVQVATATLIAYENTKNPSPAVVNEANKLLNDATAAIAADGPKAATSIAAAGSLAAYILTSAPGNGVTPSTVPVS